MKPDLAYVGSIDSHLGDDVEEIAFQLDDSEEGRRHLISIMTDLYTDFELACIREYATNARDANIEAGNGDVPIEISLPNRLSPWYIVKDRGPGLDIDGLRNVFAKYGASTKRGSNDYNGSFGLGGKAALTYTSQFTIVGIKDGVKTTVIVNRREDGVGVMKVVDTEPTDEPSGVEIRIPVKDNNSFGDKCREFFYFWQPGTVLVDGAEPNMLVNRDNMAKVGPNAYLLSRGSYGDRDVIVMGNVGYKLADRQLAESISSQWGSTVVYYVEMGEVSIAPSREGLGSTPKTAAKLDAIKQELRDTIKGQIEDDLANVDSYSEAYSVWTRWKGVMGGDKLPKVTYDGEEFIEQLRCEHWQVGIGNGRYRSSTDDYGNTRHARSYGNLSELLDDDLLVVENYKGAGPTPHQLLKIEQHLKGIGSNIRKVYLYDTVPGAPWTDDVPRTDWSIIDAIKVKRAPSQGGGKTGSIPVLVYRGGGRHSWRSNDYVGTWDTITDLDDTERILYLSPKNRNDYINAINEVFATFPGTQVVALGENRWAKFLRENPTAQEFSVYHRNKFTDELKDSMTADDLFYADHDDQWRGLAEFVGTKTDCKILTKLAGIKVDKAKIKVYNDKVSPTKSASQTYPLAVDRYGSVQESRKAHTILYINSVISEG